ncbi:MAG: SRPBCC family protein [Pseudohongiellaceae bacterium]
MADKIEKTIDLKAPVQRVWRALTDHREFGEWFRVALEKPFAVGEVTAGNITYEGYEHMRLEARVTTMDTNSLFAFNWCPVADDDGNGALGGPETLVEFILEPIASGTRLTIIESGFSCVPDDEERANALRQNSEGWAIQTQNIAAHVEG